MADCSRPAGGTDSQFLAPCGLAEHDLRGAALQLLPWFPRLETEEGRGRGAGNSCAWGWGMGLGGRPFEGSFLAYEFPRYVTLGSPLNFANFPNLYSGVI